ncbi:2-C-methyl-D-erythritol 4-phosphate cytidylyltransferase [Desulfuromonas thiophila]|uniref:2-C-methyl-D-erythritol 4-phosphate cytidylyltransferase n=1 Tax=Desulfuromonas thiophila TaxID=57664 RepID=A0A1G7ETV3_9BACT|nr:2-C-methyl-D-erythritol 4-phosphate cytidylyltransferase [Desulfuromonas thiophila]SDE66926.1 2-C-methyl-D-erythritol 4-phosphate cytidylyltransferase [Desulfuromonas thiophila]
MVSAIILASGSGLRFQDQQPKQFLKLAGMPVLAHTVKMFQTYPSIDEIVIVCHECYVDQVWDLVSQYSFSKVSKVVCGGQTRQESSRIGIECSSADYVLIHDGVRPFLSHDVIQELIAAVHIYKAVDTVIPSADTLVEVDANGFIANIPDRTRFRRGQTPQAFSRDLVLLAHRRAQDDGVDNATDDCQLVMRLGHDVFCVEGHEQNIKITYPIDLHIADKLFQLNSQQIFSSQEDLSPFFCDKVVVVIGGSEGIGASFARLMRRMGARVYVGGRHTVPGIDVTVPESVRSFVDAIVAESGRIDFVVNCAGDLIRRDVAFMSLEQWRYLYAVNVEGSFNVSKAVLPQLLRQQGGSMLFLGSSSYTRGRAGYAAYSSGKAALVNFVQALAEEVAPAGIRVNVASPGRVKTGLRERNFGKEPDGTLLSPDIVAQKILAALISPMTGGVFDIA